MRVSSSTSPAQTPAAAAVELAMLVVKKQQDSAQIEAQALLSLVQEAVPGQVGGIISAYA